MVLDINLFVGQGVATFYFFCLRNNYNKKVLILLDRGIKMIEKINHERLQIKDIEFEDNRTLSEKG